MKNLLNKTARDWLFAVGLTFYISLSSPALAPAQEVAVGQAEAQATQSVVRDQLNAFKTGDLNRAYSYAAPNIKDYFTTVDRFAGMVKSGYGAIYQSESFVMSRNKIVGNDIFQEVIITDLSGNQWQAIYTLRQQEDGSWKISGVKLNPHKGATT